MILTENCQILCRKEGIDPDCLGMGEQCVLVSILITFDSGTNNLWVLDGLHATQRGVPV